MARKMKDSGIEWIGEIPADFSLYKLKYLLSSPLCYGANESGTLYSDILPRYIRITDISPNGTLKNSGMLSLDESSAQNYMLHEGDILFARSGATVGKSFIYHNYYGRAAYAGYLIKASFNRLVLPEFVYYYTCSSAYEIWKNSIFIQSTIQNIGADRYSNLPISVPNSIDKQLRIVRYLNNFCSKFDAIVYNLQTSIEDYKKLKQAVITQAITKGVRGEREMKDSGVAWIGEIPKEWDIIKSSRIIKTTQNGLSRRDLEKSEGQIILKLKNITSDGKIDYSFLNRITLSQNELNTYALTTGDFYLFVLMAVNHSSENALFLKQLVKSLLIMTTLFALSFLISVIIAFSYGIYTVVAERLKLIYTQALPLVNIPLVAMDFAILLLSFHLLMSKKKSQTIWMPSAPRLTG